MKKVAISLVLIFTAYYSFLVSNSDAQWKQIDKSKGQSLNNGGRYSEAKFLIDTIALKYFPLAVGNVYKYHFGSSSGYQYNYKLRILKDTIISSRRYFVASNYFPGSIGQILRLDSNSGNLYVRSNSGYCSYSPFEELTDSLRARRGDSTLVCTSFVPKHYCIDTGYSTLFGMQIKGKTYKRKTTETTTTVTYGMNFGILFATYSDFWGLASESLLGCYVNGVLYGDTVLTDVENISSEIPSSYALSQNYPNPFNQTSIFKFQCSMKGHVNVSVYDIAGREVRTLVNETLQPGTYEVRFDGSGLNSGVYFVRMTAGDFTETRKTVLLK
ncbi:MAG TPA: T9SS type A sorting domain-containing protein [Ignavibacteria bacterium]|nr:T9SS type A sorting domain-containing protein [Ignavibacteria bacterium]